MQDDYGPEADAARRYLREEQKLKEQQQDEDDLKWLMNDVRGRRIVHEQLTRCKVFGSTFDQNPYQTAFNEGNRNAGLRLLAEVTSTTPEQYALMLREAKHDHS